MGFRSRSSKARSTRVLSGLISTDTDWSAFNYYRSKLHSQPNQPRYLILLTMSVSLVMVRFQLYPHRWSTALYSCKLVNAQCKQLGIQLYSKSLLSQKLLKNPVPSAASLGGKLPNWRLGTPNRVPYLLYHVIINLRHTCTPAVRTARRGIYGI